MNCILSVSAANATILTILIYAEVISMDDFLYKRLKRDEILRLYLEEVHIKDIASMCNCPVEDVALTILDFQHNMAILALLGANIKE